MIICWNCSANLFDGTIFCDSCGAALLDTAPRRVSAPLPTAELTTSDLAQALPRLILTDAGVAIPLPLVASVVIGRAGTGGPNPDVDLGPFQAADAGVSRTHAVIDLAGPRPRIEDLDSTNGTYLNGKRLSPRRPVALVRGDQIYLGQLAVRIEL